jgi:uncharacterized Zn finger protein (UPF0148 family)
MDISGNGEVTLNQITGIIEDYNENMRYYNRNMRDLIEIYREVMPPPRSETTNSRIENNVDQVNRPRYSVTIPYSTSVPIRDSSGSLSTPSVPNIRSHNRSNIQHYITNDRISFPIIYDPYRIIGHRGTNLNLNDLENVVVRPTNTQIRNATQILQYSTHFTQRQCPITLEAFEIGREVRRINHCGHIFDNFALIEWFERNVRCPVCRHDIRDTEMPRPQPQDNSGNHIYPSPSNIPNIIDYNSDSEDDENEQINYQSSQQNESRSRTQSINNQENRTFVRDYIRNVLTSVINDSSFPQLNNSVNSLFANYNIPVIFDISYTTM